MTKMLQQKNNNESQRKRRLILNEKINKYFQLCFNSGLTMKKENENIIDKIKER